MLDREAACNRVFLARRFVLFGADGVGLRFKPVFNLAAARRSTMSSPLLYAARLRQAPTSMITSERDLGGRCGNPTEPSRNSSMISRARVHARAQGRRPFGVAHRKHVFGQAHLVLVAAQGSVMRIGELGSG